MKKAHVLYRNGSHTWTMIARDPERQDHIIDTNEYLICSGNEAILLDPGGMEVFPAVFSAISTVLNPEKITRVFASHQDPDIISSLALWLEFNPAIQCWISWLWTSFIPHFGGEKDTFVPIPDQGCDIPVGAASLRAVPAHYLHSSGNFNLYDPAAHILFSGDIGAALLPPDRPLVVRDFDEHIKHAEGFHKRWMGSAEAKRLWCERVSILKIDMLCPQHGAIYQGEDVQRFIQWFDDLEIGTGNSNG